MKSKFFIIPFLLLIIPTLFGCGAKRIVKLLEQEEYNYERTYQDMWEGERQVLQSYMNLARNWLLLKNYPYAIKTYEELIKELPMAKFVVADSLLQIGKIYQDIGDYEKAIKTYNVLFEEAPESGRSDEGIYRQAVCLEAIGGFTSAYKCYKAYMKLGEDKDFYRQAQQKVKQMERDGDRDGYPYYKEQEAGTSDEDANSYPGPIEFH